MRLPSPRKTALAFGGLVAVAAGLAAPAASAGAAPAASSVTLAPYVDMGAWPTPVLSTMSAGGGSKSFTLGFVTSAGCKASWFNAYDPRAAWQADEIGKIRANGGDVKVSFGGASGIELAQACTSVPSLVTEYDAVVKAYNLKYIDLDIEGAAVADPATIQRRSQALKIVQADNPGLKISLTLPVLPNGLTSDGLNVVGAAKSAGVDVDLVNVMAMDYYQGAGDQGAKAISAAKATQAQVKSIFGLSDADAWKKVGVTPMIGVNDSQNEVFYQKDATALVGFAKTVHLGLLSFWESGRDAAACTGALYKCTNIPQQPYEFAKIFSGYRG
ncbi:chitinase [Amycolatopsis sp. PS_44_ISF1]|uniref:chitinase n=1 Tax=Amycolatopsis sp. PS_44_ISF1 TaxID=2974917 RepID=UPI0028DF0512|nr:chitinase [Amycolatopsis sp. PS_44_ISF1]MDT8915727.1 chitinase [Amycolatopsis sp. PS_44_ISF1]